jgi:hypothetical protein
MTFGHIFFIPLCAMVGMLFGFVLGARAARNAADLEKRRDAEREQARAARAARKAAVAAVKGEAAESADAESAQKKSESEESAS